MDALKFLSFLCDFCRRICNLEQTRIWDIEQETIYPFQNVSGGEKVKENKCPVTRRLCFSYFHPFFVISR
jgi:hypothetical protein